MWNLLVSLKDQEPFSPNEQDLNSHKPEAHGQWKDDTCLCTLNCAQGGEEVVDEALIQIRSLAVA